MSSNFGRPLLMRGRSRVLRALIWSAVLLLFAVAFYLVFGRKEEAKVRPAAANHDYDCHGSKGEYRGLSGRHRDGDSGLYRVHL